MRKTLIALALSLLAAAGCGGGVRAGRMIRISQGDKTWDVCSLEISWPFAGDSRLVFTDKNDHQVVLMGGWTTQQTDKPCY